MCEGDPAGWNLECVRGFQRPRTGRVKGDPTSGNRECVRGIRQPGTRSVWGAPGGTVWGRPSRNPVASQCHSVGQLRKAPTEASAATTLLQQDQGSAQSTRHKILSAGSGISPGRETPHPVDNLVLCMGLLSRLSSLRPVQARPRRTSAAPPCSGITWRMSGSLCTWSGRSPGSSRGWRPGKAGPAEVLFWEGCEGIVPVL